MKAPGRKPSSGGWELPKRYGAWELLERVGGGTLGERFRARRLADGQPAEVRIFPPNLAQRMPRALEEAKAVAALAHPHIRTAFDMGREGSTFFVALDEFDAPTLERWLTADELALPEGCAALAQVARALHAAHEIGVIHGHLRPENVGLARTDAGPDAKVENFGFEKLRTASQLVASGSVDRARFLSPEQAREAERFDARSDVYAVGVMAYRLACGRYHVEGLTIHEILRRIAEGEYIAPRSRRRDLDPDVEAVIERCLALDPEERYSTARALAFDLDRLAAGERPHARDMAPIKARTRRLHRGRRRWPWVAAAAATAGVLGLAALASRGGGGSGGGAPPPAARGPVTPDGPADAPRSIAPADVDRGEAIRTEAGRRLEAGDAAGALALLAPRLADRPDDAEALALRGQAQIARGAVAEGLADLDRAGALAGGETEASRRARAVASWARFRERCVGGTADAECVRLLEAALADADALPRPVDPAACLAAALRPDPGALAGWAAACERAIPEGLLRDVLRYAERDPLDPPGEPGDTFERAIAHWPQWAVPHAHAAMARRAAGDAAGAAAALARATALDPEHAAVHLARAVGEVLDRQPGALLRGADGWQRARGASAHERRRYALAVRDHVRAAGDVVGAAAVALTYLRHLPDEDRAATAAREFGPCALAWRDDLRRLLATRARPAGRAGAFWDTARALVGEDRAAASRALAAWLADDADGSAAAALAAARLHVDRHGLLGAEAPAIAPFVEAVRELAGLCLRHAQAARRVGNMATVGRMVGAAIEATMEAPVILDGMSCFGRAMLECGGERDRAFFRAHMDTFIAQRRAGVDLWARAWRARVHEIEGRPADAAADLDAAVAQAPGEPRLRCSRAEWRLRAGDDAGAEADIAGALAADPAYGRTHALRGFRRHAAGDVAGARADYEAALTRGYRLAGIQALAGLAAAQMGDTEAALARCAEATRDAWDARAGRLVRAFVYWQGGRRADALDELADAAGTLPRDLELDWPMERVLAPALALLREQAADVALIGLQRAEHALAQGDRAAADLALRAVATLPGHDVGRRAYLWARFVAAGGGPEAAERACEALEAAAKAGHRPPGGFGAEREFDGLRALPRFRACGGAAETGR